MAAYANISVAAVAAMAIAARKGIGKTLREMLLVASSRVSRTSSRCCTSSSRVFSDIITSVSMGIFAIELFSLQRADSNNVRACKSVIAGAPEAGKIHP